jgi:hypothetical protein
MPSREAVVALTSVGGRASGFSGGAARAGAAVRARAVRANRTARGSLAREVILGAALPLAEVDAQSAAKRPFDDDGL